jgi:SAM-dependent methyltransferase
MASKEKTGRAPVLVSAGGTADVRAMYEAYPYPSNVVEGGLAFDLANQLTALWVDQDLAGKRILDGGCGTGQRLLGAAQRFPEASFVGVDMTTASLAVARRLAEEHRIENVEFRQRNLLELDMEERFDIVTSTGVLHALEDPALGLSNLLAHLAEDGVLAAWLYHSLGEHQRLCDRELFLTLWGGVHSDRQAGFALLEELGMTLAPDQYGTGSDPQDAPVLHIDADAYMHPIVYAYRFEDAIELFEGSQVDWVAINGINGIDWSKSLDLEGVDRSKYRFVNLTPGDLFPSEALQQRFRELDKLSKLRVIELVKRPTGFTILGGRGPAANVSARVAGNVVA